jgi:ABC-type sugar transport system ATPase subunit
MTAAAPVPPGPTPPGAALRMELRGIRKSFGETRALQGVDLSIVGGGVLGIAGPNGAGKSTLMRILAGEETRDSGDITVDGAPWRTGDPRDRVAVVHQEPQLWPNLTVAQNMVVGREPSQTAFPDLPARDRDVLRGLGIDGYADRLLADCPLAVRQRVEIGRALAQDGRYFLFDEPNSALTEDESNQLFAAMHELAAQGKVVLLVTHRLGEMVVQCSRVAVIRDGVVAAELTGDALTEQGIARELVLGYQAVNAGDAPTTLTGEPLGDEHVPPAADHGPVATLSGWTSSDGDFHHVGLTLTRGETVALVGVEGSGARQLVASAAGFADATGSIVVAGVEGREAQRTRTVYLPADRRGMLFANLTVGDNLVMRLGVPEIATAGGFLALGRFRRVAEELVQRFRVRTQSAAAPLTSLSGGNQQKVAIAAAIARRPDLLVLEEPTRGVDVGSKAEIYRILRDYAREGHGVLVYCTEVPEVYELASRVIVVDRGAPVRDMRIADFPDLTSLADAIATLEHTASDGHGGDSQPSGPTSSTAGGTRR